MQHLHPWICNGRCRLESFILEDQQSLSNWRLLHGTSWSAICKVARRNFCCTYRRTDGRTEGKLILSLRLRLDKPRIDSPPGRKGASGGHHRVGRPSCLCTYVVYRTSYVVRRTIRLNTALHCTAQCAVHTARCRQKGSFCDGRRLPVMFHWLRPTRVFRPGVRLHQ